MSESCGLPDKVPFWPEDMASDYMSDIPILESRNPLRNWPDTGPSLQEVFRQLAQSKRAWFRKNQATNGENKIYILAANYSFDAFIGDNRDGFPRIRLGAIRLASNEDRRRMLMGGCQIRHEGISILSPQRMGGRESQSSYIRTGRFVSDLIKLIARTPGALGGGSQSTAPRISERENEVLETLQSFIDAEFELEERAAQQVPGFFYHGRRALPRRVVYRQFYEVQLDPEDHKRMLELKPSIFAPSDDMGLPSNVRFEVTDLEPDPNRSVVHVNIERQTQVSDIPNQGQLLLSIAPTLKRVRSDVIEAIREQRAVNPWLSKLLAEEYAPAPYCIAPASVPQGEYPNTASQEKAIRMGISAPDYGLILGPPGTGKTTVILSLVRHFVVEGKRVLVTSQNNKAVDNVLERLVENDELECVRIGNEARISSTLEGTLLENKARDLQMKLFTEVAESRTYLEEATRFLNHLDSELSHVSQSRRRWLDARDSLAGANERLQSANSDLQQLIRTRDRIVAAIERSETHIRELVEGRWPFVLDYLRRALSVIRLPLARRRLRSQENLLQITQQSIVEVTDDIERQQKALAIAEGEELESDRAYRRWFRDRPDDFVEEIKLPDADSFSEERFRKSKSEFEEMTEGVVEWHEKLHNERQRSLYPLLLERVSVVGATCVGINTNALFRNMKFDVVIVDEAGQIQAHNLVVPLSRADKVILVGDHKQLPPVVQDEMREEIAERGFENELHFYEKSWFEHLWDQTPDNRKVMLDEQFRCPSVISDYVSKAFYEGNYFAGRGMDRENALLDFCPSPLTLIDTQRVPQRYEQSQSDGSRLIVNGNRVETDLVIEILNRTLSQRPELAQKREIGVIVPYRNHVASIHQAIRSEQRKGNLTELDMPLQELVASIDSFQGQERDLIILLFTRSNRRAQIGFLREWRRLNVAVTRAKGQAVAIGDVKTLTTPSSNGSDREFKDAMRLMVDHCKLMGSLLDGRNFYRANGRASRSSPEHRRRNRNRTT